MQEVKGLPAGAFLSDFALLDLAGRLVRVSDLVGRAYFLVFVGPDCLPSAEVLAHLGSLRAMGSDLPEVVVICSGGIKAARTLAGKFELGTDVVVQEEEELSLFMRVPATPAAYRVNADRTTAGPLAIGSDAVIALLPQIFTPFDADSEVTREIPRATPVAMPAGPRRTGLPVGDVAPGIHGAVHVHELELISNNHGGWTLLCFWSPDCALCDGLGESLVDLASTSPHLAVKVVVRGTEHDAQSLAQLLGPAVPVVLQEGRSISRQYLAFETPSAYLIDPAGRIAAPLARGRQAVEQLFLRAGERAGNAQI